MTQIAWVTGHSRGLGAAIAARLSKLGHTVVGFARSAPPADSRARTFACDLLDAGARRDAFAAAARDVGPPALLIHNAGYGGPHRGIAATDDAQWHRAMELNATVAFELTRAALPAMQKRRFGRIVHIGSVLSLAGGAGSGAYAAAKHALLGLARTTAAEHAADGITCNVVCPGYLATDMTEGRVDAALLARVPAHRLGTVDEVAELVAWLCSPAAAFVNGAAIPIDGGLLADLGTGGVD
jgi:3-oxoacyl-[acyl-carrier protein] reductase